MDIESMTIDNAGYIDYLDGNYRVDNAATSFDSAGPSLTSCGTDPIHLRRTVDGTPNSRSATLYVGQASQFEVNNFQW